MNRSRARPGEAAGLPALRLVFWELTAQCNLRCRHCRAEAEALPDAGELSTDELLQCARDIRAAGDPILVLTGGEPLARPDFFEVAQACAGAFSRVALATNGTRVDDAAAKRIVDIGIMRVSISLDGPDAQAHDRFRNQPGSFDAALRGYDALRRAGMSMQINASVTMHNASQLDDMLQLALQRGADAFHLFMLVPVGCGAEIGAAERLSPDRSEETLRWLSRRSAQLRGQIHLKATCAPQYYRIIRQGNTPPPTGGGHGMHAATRGCLAGSSVCFVSRLGDVQPCGYLPLRVGNVRSEAFAEIWRGAEAFQALRDTGRLKGKCGACRFKEVCQGCRARAYAETGDFLEAEPDCAYLPPEWAAATAAPSRRQGGDP